MSISNPSHRWFRYRLRTLLGLMLLVALAAGGWRIYGQWRIERAFQALESRDAALDAWRQVQAKYLQDDASLADEREARKLYYERRREAEEAIQTAW